MNSLSVPESYAYCHQLMRSAARNFYYGMRLLPESKRQAMYALYTFMRAIDDLADDPADAQTSEYPCEQDLRRQRLEQWRGATHAAIEGATDGHPLWPAFADAVRRFQIPSKLFDDAIDGQLQDLVQNTYGTFEELYQYCYRVASTVGIAAIHIWGFSDPRALKLAEQRGIALQLTNILRDLREDSARGRCYIPAEDCRRFACLNWENANGTIPAGFEDLVLFEARRAGEYYDSSSPLEAMIERDSRPTLRVMTRIYRGILERIIASPGQVLRKRVGLSTAAKLALVVRYTCQAKLARLK